jgi:hypothetical protein
VVSQVVYASGLEPLPSEMRLKEKDRNRVPVITGHETECFVGLLSIILRVCKVQVYQGPSLLAVGVGTSKRVTFMFSSIACSNDF